MKEGNGICDTCRSAPCTVYCRADMAFLCGGCDARIHSTSSTRRHERVWVCEACERAPAAFLCKADAASLCATCDADIHSANPLASRHHRVPILPYSSSATNGSDDGGRFLGEEDDEEEVVDEDDEDEAASWLLLNNHNGNNCNNSNNGNNGHQSNGFLFGSTGEVDDDYLDLMDCNSCADQGQLSDHYAHHDQQQHHYGGVTHKNYGGDSVVPVQQQHFQLGLEFDSSKAGYSVFNASVTQNVSSFFFPPLTCVFAFLCSVGIVIGRAKHI